MTQSSKKIAVTGGIGSGKSTFCEIIKQKGYPVFSCDEINGELWQDGEYLQKLANLFPQCVENGELSKQKLSSLIFYNKESRTLLNDLAHKCIVECLNERMAQFPVCFAEVPLLYEGGYEGQFDKVIAVVRPKEERIASVTARSGLSREQVLARMDAQISYDDIEERNCLVARNDGTKEGLNAEVERILAELSL